ncbi:MAG: RNA-binding protein [Prevotellaceae bacterium]|jgi:RNA recognition motif-containing protein|nr:RNA-binding protein [Prevotellaceae bacterium]
MNIFISGLSFKATDEDLKQVFSAYGEVSSAKIITERGTRRSKGYGFVEMPNDADGNKAIAALNGSEQLGRTVNVSVARDRVERDRSY